MGVSPAEITQNNHSKSGVKVARLYTSKIFELKEEQKPNILITDSRLKTLNMFLQRSCFPTVHKRFFSVSVCLVIHATLYFCVNGSFIGVF